MSPSPITSYHNATTNNGYEKPVYNLFPDHQSNQESATSVIAKKSVANYQGDPQSCYSEKDDSLECNDTEDQLGDGFIAYLSRVREGETQVIKFTFNYFKQLKEMISSDNELRRNNSSKVQVYIVKPNLSDNYYNSFMEKVRDFAVFLDALNIQVSVVENTPELTENQPEVTENQPQIESNQPKETKKKPEGIQNQSTILIGQPGLNEDDLSTPKQPVIIKDEPVDAEQSPIRDEYNTIMKSPMRARGKRRITTTNRDIARSMICPTRVHNTVFTSSPGDIADQEKMKKIMQSLQEHSKGGLGDDSLSKKFLLVRNLIKALNLNLKYGNFSSDMEYQHRVNQLARANRALAGITIKINQRM